MMKEVRILGWSINRTKRLDALIESYERDLDIIHKALAAGDAQAALEYMDNDEGSVVFLNNLGEEAL